MKEIWKDIKRYKGLYQISNLGRIKSLPRKVINHKNGSTREIKEKIKKPTDNGNGYKIISLNNKNKRKNFYVHRLVAEHFLPKKKGKKYVNHKDYDKSNNCVENLEWCTQKENVNYSIEKMRKPRKKYKLSNTGHKYICKNKYGYSLTIKNKNVYKKFKTLEEAIRYKNSLFEKVVI